MSSSSPPLIQTLTPERWAGLTMNFIDAGVVGLLVKNGQLVRRMEPGRYFNFAIPWLEKCELVLVDTKLRNLELVSKGDFLSQDQFLINVSLSAIYQVVDPKRVALELSDPIAALTSAIKDSMGVAIGQLTVQQLTQQGRVFVRQYLLDHAEIAYPLGFALEDVRVSDVSFPQGPGVIRQMEGLSARAEATYQAGLQAQIAEAGRPLMQPLMSPMQQVNLVSGAAPSPDPASAALLEPATFVLEPEAKASLPAQDAPVLPATVMHPTPAVAATARLVHRKSGAVVSLAANPFTIGREPRNSLVLQDPLSSRYHAQIQQVAEGQASKRYRLLDVGSSNGTFVNGQRLVPNQPVWLSAGALVVIGEQEWVFEV
ncbi:FHA domain-containing protein [Leptolyngbya sp. FACHB-261]|uniref:FHA domain-containing protein n=1 Tax=Leptolyngbya sp. FACHB-261 TaxID=2692806 RepID=UPI001687E4E0|nr:FHA domain-containing protein [Leptolyngbya sp. FACHB-261]MBD2101395.1 FHA domain-containing protein [Leptolyngbya sp. FACHB-261]